MNICLNDVAMECPGLPLVFVILWVYLELSITQKHTGGNNEVTWACYGLCQCRLFCISLTYLLPLSVPVLFPPLSHLFLQRLSKRTKMVRSLVGEVVGMSPYERRMLDMLKTGGASADKRMYKFAKRRLGSHKRALKKREQVKDAYSAIRSAK